MKLIRIKGNIRVEDIKEINSIAPVIVEFSSTKNQNINLIRELSDDCIIRINPDNEIQEYEKSSGRKLLTYSKQSFIDLLNEFEEIESRMNPEWNNLEKAIYFYKMFQQIPRSDLEKNKASYDLSALIGNKTDSAGLASIYYEAMRRNGIPCKYVYNSNFDAWNEIQIGDTYYPLDIAKDSDEFFNNNINETPVFMNFLSNPEFYYMPEHKTDMVETSSDRFLPREEINKAIDSVLSYIDRQNNEENKVNKEDEIIPPVPEERKKVEIKSKELSGIFEGNEITEETLKKELPELKINVTDTSYDDLKIELEEIATYYPEILNKINISNETDTHVDFQEVVDKIYEVQSNSEYARYYPITLTISSNIAEDFDIDLSKVPKISNNNYRIDGKKEYQTIAFRNTDPSSAIQIPNFGTKLSDNIEAISFEGINLINVDVERLPALRKIILRGGRTENISSVSGLDSIPILEINSISDSEFNQFMSTIYPSCTLHDITINGQHLHDRKILRELSVNSNLVMVNITNSQVNDIDGLENFDGRLGLLNLMSNDLGVNDIERVENFYRTNPYLIYYLNNNTGIRNQIINAPDISDESFEFLKKIYFDSGIAKGDRNATTKDDAVDRLMWSMNKAPYYIKDAEIIRGNLKIKENPIMIENESEIDSTDFTRSYLQDANLLLTIPQIEHLLNSGKVIPQDVRVKIKDVSELDSVTLRDLSRRMNNVGMNISGVQILDDNFDNWSYQIDSYSQAEYIYIRDTLDRVVTGINPADSDLDKFTTIYTRLADSISYDHDAIRHDDKTSALYYSRRMNECRNLKEGIIEGKTVCAGYADILRNALSLVGIRSRLVTGNCETGNDNTGHAWNQVEIKDEHGNGKWYNTDLTWDAKKGRATSSRDDFRWMLLGQNNFIRHEEVFTQNLENVERDDYDRAVLQDAINRASSKRFDFTAQEIDIPSDPSLTYTLDNDRIENEYLRRRDDMLAKFYGDKDYEREYLERSERFKSNEIDTTSGGITYRTIRDYPEREDDEKFLLLDGYKSALERMTRFDAGDTSVYNGTSHTYDNDKEYIETRNHTFNQHEYTQSDLATLGKYGETMPYIPRQTGLLRNAGRVVLNAGIFVRNVFAPVYRFIGRNVAQPLHRLITRGRDASPYKNNAYHRMVARRDYFADIARQRDEDETERLRASSPNPASINPVRHPFRNAIEARFKALFRAKEGNEAVLRAGAADIKQNIINQERNTVLINALNTQIREFEIQIRRLEDSLRRNPGASNRIDVENAITSKRNSLQNARDNLNSLVNNGPIASEQTDAVDDKQHAIASKEVNTLRTTVIKGFAKGLAVKYIGPKIHDWILEHNKITRQVEVPSTETITTEEWVPTTYKTETMPVYDDVINKSRTLDELMASNSGKQVTGFYSVYGGERLPEVYTLSGDEKITAIFNSVGSGGHGLSDTAGLRAPTLTDGTFAADMLDSGVLRQNITVDELVNAVNDGTVDVDTLSNLYVAVGDRFWTKLSDLVPGITERVKVDDIIKTVVDVEGHYETVSKTVDTVKTVNETVVNPTVERSTEVIGDILKGAIIADTALDVPENARKTNTDKKRNKRQTREYTFDDEGTRDLPKSRREYRRQSGDER